jgi:hypothetical protein
MDNFVDWVSTHALTSLLIIGTAIAVVFIITNRKTLFYKE